MSYDIRLCDPVTKETLQADSPHQIKGGTHAMGGTTEMWLNVTYNYSRIFEKAFSGAVEEMSKYDRAFGGGEKGIRMLYGMSGAESIPLLEKAIASLKDDTDPDYWKATEGNAKQALCGLLAIAKMRPDGVWDGD